jgi:hypothetical protein
MDEKTIRLAVYSNPVEAEMAKNFLEDAGVTVFSAGSEVSGPFAGVDAAFASIELHVPKSQVERAARVLESFTEHDSALDDELAEDESSTSIREGAPDRFEDEGVVDSSSQIRSGLPPEEMSGTDSSGFVHFPGGELEDEALDTDDISIRRTPDGLASRAWRASFIGMIVLPPILNLYSIWLLIRMAAMDQEPSRAGLRKVYGALAIDAFVLVTEALIILAILARA